MICKSPEELIFPINAMSKGKERRQYTEEIQQHIRSATEKCGKAVHVPLKWLTLHLEIDKGEGVARISECYEVGRKLGMREDRVHLALEFLNQAALILYYPKGCSRPCINKDGSIHREVIPSDKSILHSTR